MSEAAPAIDLLTLMADVETDIECRRYLEELRWRDGVICPRCRGKSISRIQKRGQFDCDKCRYQFSVTAGTLFHDSHLPLPKWFVAVYLLCESKKGMSANQLRRILKVSYKTAWYLCHRIRAAMAEANHLRGDVHTSAVENGMSPFKRSIVGSFHQVSAKHIDRYFDEFEWRVNNRKNRYAFRDTMLRLIGAQALPYKGLTRTASP
jgi:transposase-like protein